MPHKPGKGDKESSKFDLIVGSKVVFFDNPRIGWSYTPSKIFLKNPTKDRYTYKVKCTNNEMFDIKSPVGFIDSGNGIDIEVIHAPGILVPANDIHHFSIYYIKCEMDAQVYSQIWDSKKPEGCKHVAIRFPKNRVMTEKQKEDEDKKKKEERELLKLRKERMEVNKKKGKEPEKEPKKEGK